MSVKVEALRWWISLLLPVASLAAPASDLRLVNAERNQDRETVRALLKQKVDVNTPAGDGATALAWAAHWDDLDTAGLLIRAGANANTANEFGITPLWEACNNASGGMVEALAKAGANPNAVVPGTGETVLMRCARTGSADAVKSLVSRGADVNAKEPKKGQTALMWAIEERHTAAARVLLENGANIHAASLAGFTPLLYAARQGEVETGKLLLEYGADVNEAWKGAKGKVGARGGVADPEGEGQAAKSDLTALLIAADSGQEAFAMFLLERGANPNATDPDGYTALHYALRRGITILHQVNHRKPYADSFDYLYRPNLVALVNALLEHGADPNARVRRGSKPSGMMSGSDWQQFGFAGLTPFMAAAAEGDVPMMRTLLAKGADPKIGTADHTTPLMAAAGVNHTGREDRSKEEEAGDLAAIKLLIELGADVNATNDDGYTAAMGAAYTGGNEILQYLVEKGAKLELKDRYGQTALSIAEGDPNFLMDDHETNYHPATAELIRKLGADPLPRPGLRKSFADVENGAGPR